MKKVKIEKSHELAGEKKKGERHYEFWAGKKLYLLVKKKLVKTLINFHGQRKDVWQYASNS